MRPPTRTPHRSTLWLSAALSAGLLVSVSGCAGTETSRRSVSNILLITVDTLRADHLSAWGYERPTSPVLDRLAGEGVRFDQAWSPLGSR